MAEICFFVSIAVLFYVYIGYPALAAFLGMFYKKNIRKGTCEPRVSILIAAYNEESCIEQTLVNKINLDYPEDKREILVVSDESTDRTDEIVSKYEDRNVRLFRQTPRAGKTSGLNLIVPEAEGEILVFSDANSIYAEDALKQLVQNFHDPEVGYVTGKMVYVSPDGSIVGDGCSAYMKYENQLRTFETGIGSVVGVDGGIDAMRKSLYRFLRPDQLPDFVQPLKVVEQGYRVIYEPAALLKEDTLKSTEDEYKMRVRVSLRTFWALLDMKHLLSVFKFGLFAWQLWSHKVLRYICFFFLVAAAVANILLYSANGFFKLCLALQIFMYLSAFTAWQLEKKNISVKFLNFPYYFILLNWTSAHAFFKFISGNKVVLWNPRKG